VHTGRHGRAPLLVRGAVLDRKRIQSLERVGIYAVYVDDEIGAGIDVPHALSEQTRARASAALGTAIDRVRTEQSPSIPPRRSASSERSRS